MHSQSLSRVVGPYTLFNLCQRLKSCPVFSDHVIVKLSCDQTRSSQNGGLTFVTCGFAFNMNTPVKRLEIGCFVCNTPNNIICVFVYMECMRCMTDHRIKTKPYIRLKINKKASQILVIWYSLQI